MNAYLIDGIRTPIGNFGGTLAPVRTDDLAAHALKASSRAWQGSHLRHTVTQ